MHTRTLVLTSLVASTALLLGCSGEVSMEEPSIDASTAALVADNDAAASLEQELEASVEVPLSGADSQDAPIDLSSGATAADNAIGNAGLYFQPEGCLTSVRDENVITHTFTDCTGPRGRTLTGTVVSTWSSADMAVSVEHVAEGFQIGGSTVDHAVTITYQSDGGVYSWTRTGSSSGTTADDRAIVHSADYSSVLDLETGCITRSGQSETSIGEREFSREISGYERCGVGALGCPRAGTFTLDRQRLHVELEFTGGGRYDLLVNERSFEDRPLLWCIAN